MLGEIFRADDWRVDEFNGGWWMGKSIPIKSPEEGGSARIGKGTDARRW